MQEYCDRGSLKDPVNRVLLRAGGAPAGAVDRAALLATCLDVARAMAHLHAANVVHADLKVGLSLGLGA